MQVAGEWKEYTKAGCGYKTDSEEENAFELKHQDSLDAAIPQLNPCRRQKKRDKVNADVARIVSEVDQLDKDHDYETDLKK